MDITDIRVFPVDEDKLKAYVTIVFDRCFMVSDIKVIHGQNGLFISMPSKRRKNGTFRDVAHPLNTETRQMIEERILCRYEELLSADDSEGKVRRPREAEQAEDHVLEVNSSAPTLPEAPGAEGYRPELRGI